MQIQKTGEKLKIKREIQERIEKHLFKGKIVVLYGARQVGKTTLIKEIQKKYDDTLYLNCDDPEPRKLLTEPTAKELFALFSGKKIIFIDEAQRIKNIGLTLKLAADTYPEFQIVATGSSSFELANEISEPLTGRVYEFHLHPFSFAELATVYQPFEISRVLKEWLVTGMYPEVALPKGDPRELLRTLTGSYLYKDILNFSGIRHPEVLDKLLSAVALQVGNEVSYSEIATLVGITRPTVENYVRILEQAFIIFRLRPFNRNHRKEITKMRKVYFYDVGIRNALLNTLNPIESRQDVGALWENFLISERMKKNSNAGRTPNIYFWRTHDGQEIDYVEDEGGKLHGFEFKWSGKKPRKQAPAAWRQAYPDASFTTITPENYLEFVM